MSGRRALGPAVGAALLAAMLAGCAGAASEAAPSTATTAPPRTAEPLATTPPAADPACDTIISSGVVDTFTAQGWTYRQDEFLVADQTLDGGLSCTWGDFSVASDHVQIFGWAPATPTQQEMLRADLLGNGWRLVEESGTTYFTEDPKTAVAKDADGYGMTYQLGDGWVRLADTKQGLLLIEWPRA